MSTLPMNRGAYGQPTTETGVLMQDISAQRKLAEQLRNQGAEQQQGQMVSGHYVAPSWSQQLAKVLQSGLGGYLEEDARKKEGEFNTTKSKKFADILSGNKPQQVKGSVETTAIPAFTPEQQDRFGSPLAGVERQPVTTSTETMTQESPEAMQARQQQDILGYIQQYGSTPEGQYLLSQLDKQGDRAYAKGEKLEDRAYGEQREEKLYNRGRTDKLSDIDAERKYQDIVRADTQGFQVSQQDRQFQQQYKMQLQSQGYQSGENAKSRAQQAEIAKNNVSPVAIIDPATGQPTYVDKRQAIGQQPYNANSTSQSSPQSKMNDAKDVLQILKQSAPLINQSTGSGLGALVDSGAAFFGGTTKGAQSAASLKALEGTLVSKMPKMSGPQSDKDVLLYKQMAGQIGDPNLPAKQKQAAMDTINELNSRYAGVPYEPLNYGNTTSVSTGKGSVSKSVYDDADAIVGGK